MFKLYSVFQKCPNVEGNLLQKHAGNERRKTFMWSEFNYLLPIICISNVLPLVKVVIVYKDENQLLRLMAWFGENAFSNFKDLS
jgi:hypothetical protein